MREPLGVDAAYKRLAELVGKRVEVVTQEGRFFGWLREPPDIGRVVVSPRSSGGIGAFALWGARDESPDADVPFRVFALGEVLGVRTMD